MSAVYFPSDAFDPRNKGNPLGAFTLVVNPNVYFFGICTEVTFQNNLVAGQGYYLDSPPTDQYVEPFGMDVCVRSSGEMDRLTDQQLNTLGISRSMFDMAVAILQGDRVAAVQAADRVLEEYHQEAKP